MNESTSPLFKLVSTFLVLPFLIISGIKELRKIVIIMKSHDYPVCRDCKFWDKSYNLCHRTVGHFEADEYCSKWEERP